MVAFQAPHWFLLLAPLALAGWYWRSWRLWLPRRVLALILVILVLADPHASRPTRALDLWVLLDRSASAAAVTESSWPEWRQLLEQSRPGSTHRLRVLNFASEAVEASGPETERFAGDPQQSRLRLAVETALSSLDPHRSARMLVFTDGYSTEPLEDLGTKLAQAGVRLDYRLARRAAGQDYRITSISLPPRRQPGQPFLLEIQVAGTSDGPRQILVSRDGGTPQSHTVHLQNGTGSLQLTARLTDPGAHRFVAELAQPDAYEGNNRAEGWVEISSGARIILVSSYPDDPLTTLLSAHGFSVQRVPDPANLHPGTLSGARLVILNNVPAYQLPAPFLGAIDFFLRQQGGGLLMLGGKHSFAAGGYFDSPLDPLLPVSMELKQEHRKLAVAMSIVMDRSGSMSAQVPGGRTKMELADEGAGRAVELLGDFDQVSVHAVDSTAHEQVPLLPVGPNRGRILDLIRRIGSGGGGIYIYEGLQAGWKSLQSASVGQRHLILFADAADSEEPGDYRNLVAEIVKNQATISVIGLGTEKDSDAGLLKDIAERGKGRIFFTSDANTLPNLFAQETVTVARSLFLEEPASAQATGRWLEISPKPVKWLTQIDGYNLSYARPEATVALLTADEYAAPLVSFVQRGIGRCAALSFPVGGEFSTKAREWPALGDFLQTLVRWLAGEALPSGIGLRTRLDGTELHIDLFQDESGLDILGAAPRILLSERGSGSRAEAVREIAWERLDPGHFRATANLLPGQVVRGAIQAGKAALPFGPIATGVNPEWTFDPRRTEEFKQAAAASGGRELVQLARAWDQPPKGHPVSLRPVLLWVLIFVLLFDALLTRTGWRLPKLAWPQLALRRSKPAVSADSAQPTWAQEEAETESSKTSAEERRARFERAKRRR